MEKLIFIDQVKVRSEIQELNNLREYANILVNLLWEFGISEPEAVKHPVDAVNEKLRESFSSNSELKVNLQKAAELIGKELEYGQILKLTPLVVNHRHLDKIRWNKKQFSITKTAEKLITDEASIYLTEEKEIELANRIEKFAEDYISLSGSLGFRALSYKLIDLMPVLTIENGKLVINYRRFKKMLERVQ